MIWLLQVYKKITLSYPFVYKNNTFTSNYLLKKLVFHVFPPKLSLLLS